MKYLEKASTSNVVIAYLLFEIAKLKGMLKYPSETRMQEFTVNTLCTPICPGYPYDIAAKYVEGIDMGRFLVEDTPSKAKITIEHTPGDGPYTVLKDGRIMASFYHAESKKNAELFKSMLEAMEK